MARISIPDLPESASAATVIKAIDANLGPTTAETTARNYIIRCLAALGNKKQPAVRVGQVDGSRVRLYVWEDTPIGGVVLAAGYAFQPKFVALADLRSKPDAGQFYILAEPDTTKAAEKAKGYTAQMAQRKATREAAKVMQDANAGAAKPRKPRTPRTPAPKPPPVRRPAPTARSAEEEARDKVAGMSSDQKRQALRDQMAAMFGPK